MEAGAGQAGAEAVLAVTNDRELRERLHAKGARTVRSSGSSRGWTSPSWPRRPRATGGRRRDRAPGRPGTAPNDDGADDRPGWKPGRGATTKTGPARKVARHKRHPRHPTRRSPSSRRIAANPGRALGCARDLEQLERDVDRDPRVPQRDRRSRTGAALVNLLPIFLLIGVVGPLL